MKKSIILSLCLFIMSAYSYSNTDLHTKEVIPSCQTTVQNTNQILNQHNAAIVIDANALVTLLHTLNKHNMLPNVYVTEKEAKSAGWSGTGSLWKIWLLNKKILGGDPINVTQILLLNENQTISLSGHWFSADLEPHLGNPSHKKLIFSPEQSFRYVSTDNMQTFVKVDACR